MYSNVRYSVDTCKYPIYKLISTEVFNRDLMQKEVGLGPPPTRCGVGHKQRRDVHTSFPVKPSRADTPYNPHNRGFGAENLISYHSKSGLIIFC
jgi:hypothetical protein